MSLCRDGCFDGFCARERVCRRLLYFKRARSHAPKRERKRKRVNGLEFVIGIWSVFLLTAAMQLCAPCRRASLSGSFIKMHSCDMCAWACQTTSNNTRTHTHKRRSFLDVSFLCLFLARSSVYWDVVEPHTKWSPQPFRKAICARICRSDYDVVYSIAMVARMMKLNSYYL